MDLESAFYAGAEGDRRRHRALTALSTPALTVLAAGPRGPLTHAAAAIVLERQIAVACEWAAPAERT